MKYKHILALLVATLLLGACASEDNNKAGSGFIEANDVIVSAETAGRVLAMNVREGQAVQTGQVLTVVDTTNLALQLDATQAAVAVAETNLNSARIQVEQATATSKFANKELERVKSLIATSSASQRQLDQADHQATEASIAMNAASSQVNTAEAEIKRLNAQIALIQDNLSNCVVKSPIGGTILDKFVEPGELVSPGKPLYKVASLDPVWVKVYLSAPAFSEVKLGDKAQVSTETDSANIDGTVVWMADEAEFTPKNVQTAEARADLVYAVKVRIANPDHALKVGQPVYVTVGS